MSHMHLARTRSCQGTSLAARTEIIVRLMMQRHKVVVVVPPGKDHYRHIRRLVPMFLMLFFPEREYPDMPVIGYQPRRINDFFSFSHVLYKKVESCS